MYCMSNCPNLKEQLKGLYIVPWFTFFNVMRKPHYQFQIHDICFQNMWPTWHRLFVTLACLRSGNLCQVRKKFGQPNQDQRWGRGVNHPTFPNPSQTIKTMPNYQRRTQQLWHISGKTCSPGTFKFYNVNDFIFSNFGFGDRKGTFSKWWRLPVGLDDLLWEGQAPILSQMPRCLSSLSL